MAAGLAGAATDHLTNLHGAASDSLSSLHATASGHLDSLADWHSTTLAEWEAAPPELDFFYYALFARVGLSLAAVVHSKAVEQAEGAFHHLKGAEVDASFVRTDLLRRSPIYWVSGALCLAAEVGLGVAVVAGGAVALPFLAASGALLDHLGRWALLHEPPPRQRAVIGGVLALAASVMAAHFAPPAMSLPGEELWAAMHAPAPVFALAVLALLILVAEVASAVRIVRYARQLAAVYACEAAVFGALSGLFVAALGSCVRFELRQHRHALFASPCVFQLAGLATFCLWLQGRRLRAAYGLGERAAVCRVHAATLVLTAPSAIAASFAAADAHANGGRVDDAAWHHHLGFESIFDVLGFGLTLALAVLALALVHRPRHSKELGAPRLDLDPTLAALLGAVTSSAADATGEERATTRSSAPSVPPTGGREHASTLTPAPLTANTSLGAPAWHSAASPSQRPAWGVLTETVDPTNSNGNANGHALVATAADSLGRPAVRSFKLPKPRSKPLAPNEWRTSLSYLIPDSPRAPSFRPSLPLRAFSAATAHPDGHDPYTPGRKGAPADGDEGGTRATTLAELAAHGSAVAEAVANAHAQVRAHAHRQRDAGNAGAVGNSPRCRQVHDLPPSRHITLFCCAFHGYP